MFTYVYISSLSGSCSEEGMFSRDASPRFLYGHPYEDCMPCFVGCPVQYNTDLAGVQYCTGLVLRTIPCDSSYFVT